MKQYMMIFRNERTEGFTDLSPEQMQAMLEQWKNWIQGIAAAGNYTATNRLLSEGKSLHAGNVIKDGPYAEVKEVVGGYLIVKAATLDAAVEMAKGCPIFNYGGNVEVRSVLPINYDVNSKHFLEGLQ